MIKSIIPYLFYIDRKLLKYLSVFLICLFGFGFIGFSDAGYLKQIGTYSFNPYISSFDINFSKSGNPLTMNLGYTKQMFVLYQNSNSFCGWFWNSGLPYIYCYGLGSSLYQGNITEYEVCRELVSSDYNKPGGCVIVSIGESSVEVIKTFLSSLTNDDYFLFDMTYGNSTSFYSNAFCFSNHLLGKSFCFNFTPNNSFNNTLSLNGNLNFDSFPSSYLQNPPGFASGGSSSQGGNIQGSYSSLSGNVVYAPCTNGAVLNYYREIVGFNDNMCFGGLNTFDILTGDYIAVPLTGKTVFEIYENTRSYGYNGYQSFSTWFVEMQSLYDGVISARYSPSVLNSYPTVLKTYFDLYYRFNPSVEPEYVNHYCNLLLNSDLSAQSDISSWPQYPKGDYDYICNGVGGSSSNVGLGNGIGSDWSGIGSGGNSSTGNNSWSGTGVTVSIGSGNVDTGFVIYDGINFMSTYFNTLKKNFINPNGSFVGILPNYIIVFLLAVIFFKFLRH